ncbi:stalk domain-containing protein [Marinicrinis sediminis]|uniref:Stalk domain-containing protein n=1 Tax=Marinicrinis sediminis TaxID=1652465 RepID=A0ABW5RE71_9BACL
MNRLLQRDKLREKTGMEMTGLEKRGTSVMNSSKNKRQRNLHLAAICVMVLSIAGTAAGSTQIAHGDNSTYAPYVTPAYAQQTAVQKPVWSVDIDHNMERSGTQYMTAGDGKVFYLHKDKLVAVKADTGQAVWTFGSGMLAVMTMDASNSTLYAASSQLTQQGQKQQTLYALHATNGKVKWKISGLTDLREVIVDEQMVFAGTANGLIAYDEKSGKPLWSHTEPYANYAYGISVQSDVVLQHYVVSGAITHGMLAAFDRSSGTLLWSERYLESTLAVDGDHIYVRKENLMIDESDVVYIEKRHIRSGKVERSFEYASNKAEDQMGERADQVVIDGEWLWIARGDQIFRYHRDADPARTEPVVHSLGAANAHPGMIAGPYADRIFYSSGSELASYFRSKQLYTSYQVDNPISRLELINNGVYVGQTDGAFKIFDVQTGKTLLHAQTNARLFADILIEGNSVLVQAERKLLAFTNPAQAAKSIEPVNTQPSVVKAEANLIIDGVKKTFSPQPVFVHNRLFVPFRSLFTAVGAKVDYEAVNKTVHASYQDKKLSFRTGAATVQMGEDVIGLSQPTFLYNNTTYLPLRDISELLGAEVKWDGSTRTVQVITQP